MSNANRFWYVLQTSFHRELQIQLQLNRMRIRSFIPMHYEETTESGRRRIRRKPAVHNLIFVRISPAWLQKIKTAKLIPAKCMYDKTTQMPLIVPDKQMDDFIALTEGKFEDVLLIDPSTEELERGDMVRITSGMFAGIEGEYIRYRSKNRVVVRIEELRGRRDGRSARGLHRENICRSTSGRVVRLDRTAGFTCSYPSKRDILFKGEDPSVRSMKTKGGPVYSAPDATDPE